MPTSVLGLTVFLFFLFVDVFNSHETSWTGTVVTRTSSSYVGYINLEQKDISKKILKLNALVLKVYCDLC